MVTSEINYDSGTIVDLENDSITPEVLLEGETAHDATGASIIGTMRTVPDSAMLGGKAPEYYTNPLNLLVNSYFINPVNQRGQTSYTGPVYGIDRWMANANNNVVTVHDGYVSYKNTGTPNAFRQVIGNASRFVGKTLTLAFECQMEESAICRATMGFVNASGTAISSHNGSDVTNVRGVSVVSVTVPEGTEYIYAQMNVRIAGGTVRMYWAALYEGGYTAETLPPYVPTHPRIESLKLGNPVQPVNLLANSYFAKPVGQAGLGDDVYHGSDIYPADRWKEWTVGTTHHFDPITGLTTSENCTFAQVVDVLLNKPYTIALGFSDGTVLAANGVLSTENSISIGSSNGIARLYVSGGVTYFSIGFCANCIWVALYEGSYTAETLPPYVPPDSAVDLMKCKYRYQKYRFATWAPIGSGFSSNVTTAYLFFTLEAPLAHDANISLKMTGNILYRVNGKTYNIDASTGTVLKHINMLAIQFPGLSIDSSDLNSAGFFINGGTSALTVEISADL